MKQAAHHHSHNALKDMKINFAATEDDDFDENEEDIVDEVDNLDSSDEESDEHEDSDDDNDNTNDIQLEDEGDDLDEEMQSLDME